jgi:hypothetical protein
LQATGCKGRALPGACGMRPPVTFILIMLVNRIIVHYNYVFSTLMCQIPQRPRGVFKIPNKEVQEKSARYDSLPLKLFWEDDMAFADSLIHFPIVKVIPLKALDAEKERLGEATLRSMVINALVSFDDIETIWKTDHDSTDLKDKFQKLHYQLDSLKKYCEGNERDV